jgi:hypothetical protein
MFLLNQVSLYGFCSVTAVFPADKNERASILHSENGLQIQLLSYEYCHEWGGESVLYVLFNVLNTYYNIRRVDLHIYLGFF